MTHQALEKWIHFAITLNVFAYAWQIAIILEENSGASVSATALASAVGVEVVNIVYGSAVHSTMFMFNAWICLIGQIAVLGVLKQHKDFHYWEKAVCAAWVCVVAGAFWLPFKNAVQLVAAGMNALGSLAQPVELATGKGTGALSRIAMVASTVSAAIWTVYCHVNKFWGPEIGFAGFAVYQLFNLVVFAIKDRQAAPSQ